MRMDPHNMVKYKAHMPQIYASPNTCAHPPSPTHLHQSHKHLHHPLHTPPPSPTPTPFPPDTSTIPSTHLHHPYTHLHYPIHTPPPSPTYTSTIPYTHLHYPLHTPPPSPTHLHYPIHTPPPFVCLPAVYIAPITTSVVQHPVRGNAQKRFAPNPTYALRKSVIRFAPNPSYALRQIRHTLCAKSVIRFAPNPIWSLCHMFCAKYDLVLRYIALMSNVLLRDLPGHRGRTTYT